MAKVVNHANMKDVMAIKKVKKFIVAQRRSTTPEKDIQYRIRRFWKTEYNVNN